MGLYHNKIAHNVANNYTCSMVSVHVWDSTMSPTKTAKPTEMPLKVWTRVGPRNLH